MYGLALGLRGVREGHRDVERFVAFEAFAHSRDEPGHIVAAEQAMQSGHPAATRMRRWPVHSHGVTSTAAMSSVRDSWAIASPGTSG